MNKKADFDMIVNFFRLLFLIVVFLSILLLSKAFITQKIDIFEVESKLLANRIALSDELNFFDENIHRAYIGVIDLQKFVSEDFGKNILNSIYYGEPNLAASAKLTLKDLDDGQEYAVFYNKGLYNEKKVLVEAKLAGAGAAKRFDTNLYVLIKDGDKFKKGVLNIDAILPNR